MTSDLLPCRTCHQNGVIRNLHGALEQCPTCLGKRIFADRRAKRTPSPDLAATLSRAAQDVADLREIAGDAGGPGRDRTDT